MIQLKNKELEKLLWTLDATPLTEEQFREQAFEVMKLLATSYEDLEGRYVKLLDLYGKAVEIAGELSAKLTELGA